MSSNWVKGSAKLVYDPYRPGIKKVRKGELIVAEVDTNIAEYYRWWVKKRYGLRLQNTAWISHITIVDGKSALDLSKNENWKKFHGQFIEFEYSVEIEQHWKFWTLPVRSNDLMMVRKSLGLAPSYNFHITFGRME